MITPTVALHIAAGTVALGAGFAALALAKGGKGHALAGRAFAVAMLGMAGTGFVLSVLKPTRISSLAAAITLTLVVTSWSAARRKKGIPGPVEVAGATAAAACAATGAVFGWQAYLAPDGRLERLPSVAYLVFASLACLTLACDIRFLISGKLSSSQRIRRHLWRMCTAFLIAAFSFFVGQQKVMPAQFRGSPFLLLPEVAIVLTMIFWLLRDRLRRRYLDRGPLMTNSVGRVE